MRSPATKVARSKAPVRAVKTGKAAATPAAATKSNYSIEVLDKAVDILGIFTQERPSLALKDVAELTGLPKTTVFRVLSTLVNRSLCELDEKTGEYSLGLAFLRFAEVRRRQVNAHDAALPIMREIRNAVNETVVLSIRHGDFRVHIDSVEGWQSMRRIAELGVQAPLYTGAASKVLLAGLDADALDDYLSRTELKRYQPTTITDKRVLRAELQLISERGYAESRSELFPGGGSLAAPIHDQTGQTVAVVDILTPEHRYTPEHRERCIALLLEGTQRISERLGYEISAPQRLNGASSREARKAR